MAQLPMDTAVKASFEAPRALAANGFDSSPKDAQYNSKEVLSNFGPDELAHLMALTKQMNGAVSNGISNGAGIIASMTKQAGKHSEADINNIGGPAAGGGVEKSNSEQLG